jgi:voltage-gated potassium channel Kch
MIIPLPTLSVAGLVIVIIVFTLTSRLITVFPPLYAMRQGIRASLLPAINLAQISEFSLVLIQVGVQTEQVGPQTASAASTGFVILAVVSTFLMMRSDAVTRAAIPLFKRFGLSDLDQAHTEAEPETQSERKRRIVILGFYRVASSFLAELERTHAALLEQVFVVDFNPTVYHSLKARGIKVHYGDIAHVDTLAHAGITEAEIVISSVPDSLLKGTSNERLVRHIRASNPSAKIIATADVLAETQTLYAAGADYVTIARLDQANELVEVVTAVEAGLIDDMRSRLEARLRDRREILP